MKFMIQNKASFQCGFKIFFSGLFIYLCVREVYMFMWGGCLHVCMCVVVPQIHLNLCMWRSRALSVVTHLIFSGRPSPRDRKSPIKLGSMLLPRTQVLSPAPTWSLTIICKSSCKGFSTLFWPLCVPDMYVIYFLMHRQNTHTYKIKINMFLKINYQPWPWHC